MSNCGQCGKPVVGASGPIDSKILMVGEFPGYYEFKRGHAWAGPAGKVLEHELRMCGLELWSFRSTNLWQHEPRADCSLSYHKSFLENELLGKDAALFMGSTVCKELFGVDISDVNALPIQLFPLKVAVVAYNPAMANQRGAVLGEFRLAVRRFVELLKENDIC